MYNERIGLFLKREAKLNHSEVSFDHNKLSIKYGEFPYDSLILFLFKG